MKDMNSFNYVSKQFYHIDVFVYLINFLSKDDLKLILRSFVILDLKLNNF